MIFSGVDMTTSQKRLWGKARAARKWFADNGPPDAPPLPLSYDERETLKRSGNLNAMVALYARSLAEQSFDWLRHPSFDDYARGVMASQEHGYDRLRNDEELQKRFPPQPLEGLGRDLSWRPPKEHAKIMASWQRSDEFRARMRAA